MGYPYPFQTQFDAAGSGRNDCYEACLAAYLRAKGTLPKDMSDADALNQVSLACRQLPDQPYNAETNLSEASRGLGHYGLPSTLTYDYTATIKAAWGILLVDGTVVRLKDGSQPYPEGFFGGSTGPNHFMISGPAFNGSYAWCMNPLAVARQWAEYDMGSVQRSFTCAYLLPSVPGEKPTPPTHWAAARQFGLLPTPQHGATALAIVPAGGTGLTWGETRVVAGETFMRGQWRSVYGWWPAAYVK